MAIGCKPFGCCLKVMLFLVLVTQNVSAAGTIVGSKHDLSASSATNSGNDEICVFCHTPHGANIDLDNDGLYDADHATRPSAPLWNRIISTMSAFTMYTSATMNADCDATPSPISLVCLSCHDSASSASIGLGVDGAVAKADTHFLVNEPNREGIFNPNRRCAVACHSEEFSTVLPEFWEVGPDLTNDHPISMPYPTPDVDPNFFVPPDTQKGWSDVKLFRGRVECPSCHNPHDPTNEPFLRKTMAASALCTTCHNI